jgi:hypothetical protein
MKAVNNMGTEIARLGFVIALSLTILTSGVVISLSCVGHLIAKAITANTECICGLTKSVQPVIAPLALSKESK